MALGALSLSVTQGVQGRPFAATIQGLTTGRVEVLSDGAPGFGTVNGRVMSNGLPYPVSTVVLREYEPGVGQGYRDSRIEIKAATRDELRAQAVASLAPGRTLRRWQAAGTVQPDLSIVYTLRVEDDLGATAGLTVGTSPLPLRNLAAAQRTGNNWRTAPSGSLGFAFQDQNVLGGVPSAFVPMILPWSNINQVDTANPNAVTYGPIWLERVSTGQVVPITFGGARTITVPANDARVRIAADEIAATAFTGAPITRGEVFRTTGKGSVSTTGDRVPAMRRKSTTLSGSDFRWFPTGTDATGQDYAGALVAPTGAGSTQSVGFSLVLAGRFTTAGVTSVGGYGDSIFDGLANDGAQRNSGQGPFEFINRVETFAGSNSSGVIANAGLTIPTLLAAQSGEPYPASDMTRISKRAALIGELCTVLVDEMGTNRFKANSSQTSNTAAAVLAQARAAWAHFRSFAPGLPILHTKLMPATLSNPAGAPTKAAQTPVFDWIAGGEVDQFHTLLAGEVTAGTIQGLIETRAPVGDPSDHHYWISNGQVNWYVVENTTTDTAIHPYPEAGRLAAFPIRAAIEGLSAALRLHPVNADTFWVMAATDRGTALGHRFIRNQGGATGADAGAPWQPWRLSATKEYAALSDDPISVTPIYTYTDDVGAQNYAFSRVNGVFFGSYHGGETLVGQQIIQMDGQDIDPTQARTGSTFHVQHSSTCTDGTATVTVTDFRTAIGAGGRIDYTHGGFTSSATLLSALVGHLIGSADTYEEVGFVPGGATEYLVPNGRPAAGSQFYTPAPTALRLRAPASGRSLRNAGFTLASGGVKEGRVHRTGARTKTYFELATGGTFGTRGAGGWTTTFETGAAGATAFPASVLTNGGFDTDLTGWTQTGGTTTWASGTATQSRSATIQNKLTQLAGSLDTTGYYLFVADASTVNGRLVLGINTNGSTLSAPVDIDPVIVGRNGRVIQPTQAQLQAILMQNTGTAGAAEAWDNVALVKAVPA